MAGTASVPTYLMEQATAGGVGRFTAVAGLLPFAVYGAQKATQSTPARMITGRLLASTGAGIREVPSLPLSAFKKLPRSVKELSQGENAQRLLEVVQQIGLATGDTVVAERLQKLLRSAPASSVQGFIATLLSPGSPLAEPLSQELEPSPIPGISSFLDGKIIDPDEQREFVNRIRETETPETRLSVTKQITEINKNGRVLPEFFSQQEPLTSGPVKLEPRIPVATATPSLTTSLANGMRRQDYEF
jgi:hypothetical protein